MGIDRGDEIAMNGYVNLIFENEIADENKEDCV